MDTMTKRCVAANLLAIKLRRNAHIVGLCCACATSSLRTSSTTHRFLKVSHAV